jgi:guanine deaminase
MDVEALMRVAIEEARSGIAAGQMPFGSAIAVGDEIIARGHNSVWANTDITAHAEILALREACHRTGAVNLPGAIVAATCMPCPMCATALHWAGVDTVYHGAEIDDAVAVGIHQVRISVADMLRDGGSTVKIVGGILRDECRALFDEWRAAGNARMY